MSMSRPLFVASLHEREFTPRFISEYLPENLHVFDAFEREALAAAKAGHVRYSARTIVEVLRHHSASRVAE